MSDEEKRMTFTEHLAELRTRIIRSGIAVAVAMMLCYIASNKIIEALVWPLLSHQAVVEQAGAPVAPEAVPAEGADAPPAAKPSSPAAPAVNMTVLNPLEIVFVQLKIAGYGGLVLAFPFVLWQLCSFIFPGLKPTEQRVVQILIVGCSGLALVGVGVAYFGILPVVLPYLQMWVPEGWLVQMRASETLSIIIKFLVGFAVAFQFPMITLVLVYMGLLTPATLRAYRKIAIVGIALGSALLTPPDPGSMIIMMIPLLLLYEVSIWLSYVVVRRKRAASATN